MHIEPTKFLEDGAPNAEFDVDGRLRIGSTGLDRDDNAVAEAITAVENDKDEKEDPRKKNRHLKREK